MTILEQIIAKKKEEVLHLKAEKSESNQVKRPAFYPRARAAQQLQIIAEIKRASPSKGDIQLLADPVTQAQAYAAAGVDAISVLTDSTFFKGSYTDLQQVAAAVNLPLLCKDFMIDEKQLIRAKNCGASIILLIVAALSVERLTALFAAANELGLEVLVETHNQAELAVAHQLGAQLIGVNNRDLKSFEVRLATSEQLVAFQQEQPVYISESGFQTGADSARVRAHYQGILVGESLMRASNIAAKVQDLRTGGKRGD